MKELCVLLLLFLVQPVFSLEPDVALSIVLNDTITIHIPYTKLFKVSNRHPSLGKEDVTILYALRKNGEVVLTGSFRKSINRYTTTDTGFLLVNETGIYVLCGHIRNTDSDTSNNEACKTIHVVDAEYHGEETETSENEDSSLGKKQVEQSISYDITKRDTKQNKPSNTFFHVNITQAENATVSLLVNTSQSFTLSLRKGTKKIFSSSFPKTVTTIVLPIIPEKEGLYTIEVTGFEKKKLYSLFLHGPSKAESPPAEESTHITHFPIRHTPPNEPLPLQLFALLFFPALLLAAFVILQK